MGGKRELSDLAYAMIVGVTTALFYDLGTAAAGGKPLTLEEAVNDVTTGALGGISGQIALEVSHNEIMAAVLGAFMTGYLTRLLCDPKSA